MQIGKLRLLAFKVALLGVFWALTFSNAKGMDGICEDSGEYSYICGPVNPEDLVLVPGTKWIVASGYGGNVPLYLVDSAQKTWSNFYPAGEAVARQDMTKYGACPGAPDPKNFVTHGLNVRPGANGHSTLYVVGHGGRESIEVFDVDASGDVPVLTWTGCVMMPDGMAANSVASLADGSLLTTIPLYPGISVNEALSGRPTGAVYEWSPEDSGFTRIEGTEIPFANGIEVSEDGREFYVSSTGLQKVLAFSNSNPSRLLRSSKSLSFVPDNLHMGSDGRLITAGLAIADSVCGDLQMSMEFDLEKFASCARPFTVLAVDPQSMEESILASSPAQKHFSNITMALEVGGELWIGTFAGDRIAYRSMERDSE